MGAVYSQPTGTFSTDRVNGTRSGLRLTTAPGLWISYDSSHESGTHVYLAEVACNPPAGEGGGFRFQGSGVRRGISRLPKRR